MGRRSSGNFIPQKTNNSIEHLVGNEEKEYPVSEHSRAMLIMTNEPNDIYKKNSQRRNY
jgi:hypothetical protein